MEFIQEIMQLITQFIDVILHLDVHLTSWANYFGPWLYLILFLIVFCETGLIIFPFLPGDSLLFALGALCAAENSSLSLPILALILILAAVIGDALNYSIGKFLGPKVFTSKSKWLNHEHLTRTQKFYEKHGGKTIILARYMPIVRTFAPFVAGIGKMNYPRFFLYNVVGAISWVIIFLVAGFYFGNLPSVKKNFHVVIFAIIIISFLPVAIEFLRGYFEKNRALEKPKAI